MLLLAVLKLAAYWVSWWSSGSLLSQGQHDWFTWLLELGSSWHGKRVLYACMHINDLNRDACSSCTLAQEA